MQRYYFVRAAVSVALLSLSLPALSAEADHPVELEEVVVTASPIGDPDRLATIAGSVARDQLLRGGANTVGDAINRLPGVTSTSYAAGAGRPVIRGMDANRVRTLEDGIGSFDVSDVGPDHAVPLDPWGAERIEVVRGAATVRYGSQAIGGVVNAVSNRVPVHLADGTRSIEGIADFGSAADSRDVGVQLNMRSGAWALHADGVDRHDDDYDTPDGETANSWLRGKAGAIGGAWIGNGNRIGVGVVRNDARYGIPAEDAFIDMEQTKLSLRSAWALPLGAFRELTVDGGWADYEHSERDEVETHSTFKDEEWDVRAEAVAGQAGFLNESAVGVQVQRKDFSAGGEGEEYLAPTRTDSAALFAFGETHPADLWRIQFGARVENTSVEGTPASDVETKRSFTPVSGSLGFVLEPAEDWRLGLSLSSSGRAPAQTELYARGVHEATATWEIGDPEFKVERANSAELTLRWRHGRVHADGAVWVSDFKNYIFGEFTGRTCSEEGDCVDGDAEELTELLYIQQGARFHGAEGHAEIELAQVGAGHLHLQLMADTVRAKLDGGGNVPRIPPWRVGGGLAWVSSAFDANVFVRRVGTQKHVAAEEFATGAFTNLDAELAWRPWPSRQGTELALVGRNLTDSRQRSATAFNKEEVLQPGRDLRVMLRVKLD